MAPLPALDGKGWIQVLCRSPRTNLDIELLKMSDQGNYLVNATSSRRLQGDSQNTGPYQFMEPHPKSFLVTSRTLKTRMFILSSYRHPIPFTSVALKQPSCPNFTMVYHQNEAPKMWCAHFWLIFGPPKKNIDNFPLRRPFTGLQAEESIVTSRAPERRSPGASRAPLGPLGLCGDPMDGCFPMRPDGRMVLNFKHKSSGRSS